MTWAYIPSTCLDFAPASADSSLPSELPNPALAESLTWRGKPLPSALWSRRWKRGGFIRLLSGLTLEPSKADDGVERFIASLRATPASPIPSPGSARGAATTVGSSTSSSASLMKAGLLVSSAKTSRGTSTDSSTPSSRLWKGWATALRLESSQRAASEPPIAGSDFSSWQTARATTGAYTRDGGEKGKERPSLHGQAEEWGTPLASERAATPREVHHGVQLANQVNEWPTAKALSGGPNSERDSRGAGGPDLQEAAQSWPTPQARDGDGRGATPSRHANPARKMAGNLDDAASAWPTPSAEAPNDREEPESWRARQAELVKSQANGNGAGVPLSIAAKEAAQDWQTPGTDSFRGRSGPRKEEAGLDRQAREIAATTSLRTSPSAPATPSRGPEAGQRSEWGSPRASDGEKGSPRQSFGGGGEPLASQATNWPTPDTQNHRDGSKRRKMTDAAASRGSRKGISLHHEVDAWPTPTACSPNSLRGSGQDPEERKADGRTVNLQDAACHWPTPAARDYRGQNSEAHITTNGSGRMHMDQLPNLVAHAFLPPAQPTRVGRESLMPCPFSPLPSEAWMCGPMLADALAFRRWSIRSGGAAGWRGTWTRRPRRSLNPLFVELMMGWPFGLSGFARVGTGLSPWLELMRGRLSELCSPPTGPQGTLF